MVLPLPTVPFVVLAAFLFARSSPRLERKLVEHPTFGPHIRTWRKNRAISRQGKIAALIAFTLSAIVGFVALDFPISLLPCAVNLIGGVWIWSRPER